MRFVRARTAAAMMSLLVAAVAPAACGRPVPVHGSLVVDLARLPIDQLVERSSAIVLGQVVSTAPARWDTPAGSRPTDVEDHVIFHDVTVLCLQSLKGPIEEGEAFIIRMRGGTVGADSLTVEGEAALVPGQTAYLLLNPPYWDHTPNVWSVLPTGVLTDDGAGHLRDQLGSQAVDLSDFIAMVVNSRGSR